MELTKLNIQEAHKGLVNKKFSALELTKAYLDKISKKNKDISSFLTVTEELAISQAKESDKKISQGEVHLLTGIPMNVKDNILVKGVKNTCASKILEDYVAPYDATCIKKLKEIGAVILGKTNLDEFAMGSSTENSAFGPTKNPHDLERVPGGTSGGPTASVAADLSCYALGSDTGGSIRQPASFCGVVGLKPTYGAVSRYGLVAFASSLDQIGPVTKTVEDAQIVFDAIRGNDPKDSTSLSSSEVRPREISRGRTSTSLRIGIPKEYFVTGIDPEVEKIVKQAIDRAEKQGIELVEISLPHTKYALATYYIIMPSEASSNLARYDGVKYGLSKKEDDLLSVYLKTRQEGFGDEVKRRIMLGTYALSAGYYDAYYLKAQKVRTLIKQDFDKAFEKVDAIFTPTCPTTAFKLGEKIEDPLSMYLSDIFTVSVNLVGLPAVSIPVGLSGGLPVGLQIIGKPFEEDKILNIGKIYA